MVTHDEEMGLEQLNFELPIRLQLGSWAWKEARRPHTAQPLVLLPQSNCVLADQAASTSLSQDKTLILFPPELEDFHQHRFSHPLEDMQMDGKLAKELYSEALDVSKVELNPLSNYNGFDDGDCEDEDGSFSFWGGSDEDLDKASDLDREWQRRHNQFHTIGYRDGLIAGKEASSQEGFNVGFKESVPIGYNWGLVRGVTSVWTCLPDKLKEMLFETQEMRNKFQDLNKSVRSLSTTDALKLFHDDVIEKKEIQQSEGALASSTSDLQERSSNCNHLDYYVGKFQSLLLESPQLKVRLLTD